VTVGPRPLVTCIVPVFNGARFLGEAVASILHQGHSPLEVIAVDDGSTDDSPEILASFGARVRVIRQANAGPAAARNTGVREARGEFLAFLDQDDRWHPEKLLRQLAVFEADPRLDLVVAHVECQWEAEEVRTPDQPRSGVTPGYVTGTLLARRQAFDLVGPFDPALRFVDGLDWFIRAADRKVPTCLMTDVLLYHRVHAHNLSRRGHESRAECLRVLRRALGRRRGEAFASPS
jgi:glycosyltransferase involved in cell wall biosynthesis